MATTAAAAAEKLHYEILQTLDDVYGIVFDGPDMSDEQVELLELLPADELELIAAWADEYAENVRDYALLARLALQAKTLRRAGCRFPEATTVLGETPWTTTFFGSQEGRSPAGRLSRPPRRIGRRRG